MTHITYVTYITQIRLHTQQYDTIHYNTWRAWDTQHSDTGWLQHWVWRQQHHKTILRLRCGIHSTYQSETRTHNRPCSNRSPTNPLNPAANQNTTRSSPSKTIRQLSTNQKPRKCHDPIKTQMKLPKSNKWGELCRAQPLCNHKCRKCRNKTHVKGWNEPLEKKYFINDHPRVEYLTVFLVTKST